MIVGRWLTRVHINCGHVLGPDVATYLKGAGCVALVTNRFRELQCEVCDKICDKYLEYEGTLLLLDVALQNRTALRHLLMNSDHRSTILKATLLTLIIDGYCRYFHNITTLFAVNVPLSFHGSNNQTFR